MKYLLDLPLQYMICFQGNLLKISSQKKMVIVSKSNTKIEKRINDWIFSSILLGFTEVLSERRAPQYCSNKYEIWCRIWNKFNVILIEFWQKKPNKSKGKDNYEIPHFENKSIPDKRLEYNEHNAFMQVLRTLLSQLKIISCR